MEVESSWNVMAHGDAREGKWRGNWRMEWVISTLHTTSEHGLSSITTADAHTSAASSRLYWRPRRFKWTRPFRRKKKSDFCPCAITFQLASTMFIAIYCHYTFSGYLICSNYISSSVERYLIRLGVLARSVIENGCKARKLSYLWPLFDKHYAKRSNIRALETLRKAPLFFFMCFCVSVRPLFQPS